MLYTVACFSSDLNNKKVEQLRRILDKDNTYSENDFEYLFIVGGDGSFIHFVKEYAFKGKKIIGVKGGCVSFLSGIDVDKLESFDFSNFSNFENLELLQIKHENETIYALNDIYISGDLFLETEMFINDLHLQSFRGSGILISTQLGSTAKNKSLGGPVLFPGTKSWLINEIGSQSNNKIRTINSPLVISNKEKVSFKNLNKYRIYIDGKFTDLNLNELEISLVQASSQMLFNFSSDYIHKLKNIFLNE